MADQDWGLDEEQLHFFKTFGYIVIRQFLGTEDLDIMVGLCKKISEAKGFSNFILLVIGMAAVVAGMQTYKDFESENRVVLNTLDSLILGIFIFEVIVKIIAQGKKPQNYFKDSWNVFDFTIVAVCLLPIESNDFVAVLRLARVMRVLKLVSALPRLQVLVNAVLKSIPSIGYVFLLATLHFYIYGCMATFLYSENDPVHFRNYQTSLLSLFLWCRCFRLPADRLRCHT